MFKNTSNTLKTLHGRLSSNSLGIWKNNNVFTRVKTNYMPRFYCNTASFTKFDKKIFGIDPKISYHLSGYGVLKNEAFLRFLGESAERYSFTSISASVRSRLIKSSYEELREKFSGCNVLPMEYINIYDDININESTEITWVKMNSFNKNYEYVFIPAAFVIMGWDLLSEEKDLIKIKAVSTGTACHKDFKNAINNSIIEYMQLDSTNLWWQCGIKGKKVDDEVISNILKEVGIDNEFFENFRLEVNDISFDKPIKIYTCEIFSKNEYLPKYAIGIQGGKSEEEAIYRGVMEGLTILEYAYNYMFFNEENYKKITRSDKKFYDLDKNVIYYSKYGKCDLNTVDIDFNNENQELDEDMLIRYVAENYRYAGYLDISIEDFKISKFSVARVIIPELTPLYMPSLIPMKHPRFNKYKVINDAPHPMP